jgi:hypothetical protein
MSGWVKIHRCLSDHWVWGEPEALKFWLTLLMDANHTDKKKLFNGALIEIKRGQILFGLNAYEKKTGISQRKMRRYLDALQKESMIDRQKTNKFSLITVVNYEEYQSTDSQASSKRQANDTQTTTPKNVNNVKKRKYERDDVPYREIVDSYNELISDPHNTPYAKDVTDKRIKAINGRWDWMTKNAKKKKGLDFFVAYFDYASQSDFLCGKTKEWKANLDWLLKEENFMKVIEGNYHHD